MKLHIKATNLVLTEDLETYIEEKLGGLEKFTKKYGTALEAWVEVGRTTRHHKEGDVFRAEIDVRVPGKILRSEAAGRDVYLAIDETRREMERQLKEYRGKFWTNLKKGARTLKDFLRFGRFFQ